MQLLQSSHGRTEFTYSLSDNGDSQAQSLLASVQPAAPLRPQIAHKAPVLVDFGCPASSKTSLADAFRQRPATGGAHKQPELRTEPRTEATSGAASDRNKLPGGRTKEELLALRKQMMKPSGLSKQNLNEESN